MMHTGNAILIELFVFLFSPLLPFRQPTHLNTFTYIMPDINEAIACVVYAYVAFDFFHEVHMKFIWN